MVLTLRGDVLALRAVAARRRLHERALLVAQRDGQAVDLRLGRERDGVIGAELQEAAHALRRSRSRPRRRRHCRATASARDGAPCRSLRPAPRRRASTGCRGARARGSAPRSPRCAGAARRSRRRRSPARPAGSRARRGGAIERARRLELGLGLGSLQLLDGSGARVLVAHQRSSLPPETASHLGGQQCRCDGRKTGRQTAHSLGVRRRATRTTGIRSLGRQRQRRRRAWRRFGSSWSSRRPIGRRRWLGLGGRRRAGRLGRAFSDVASSTSPG